MSRVKRGSAADEIYNTHLFGASGKFNANPAVNREALITRNLQRNISELAVNRFKWENLPESIDPRFLEMCLFYNALAVFYWDKDYDKLLAVRGSGTGFVNMLDNPVSFTVIGPGSLMKPTMDTSPAQFQNKIIPAYNPSAHFELLDEERRQKGIPVWANYLRSPEHDTVMIYATRLAWLDRTLEINTRNARRNKIIKGSPNLQLSMVNGVRGLDQGDDLIQVTGALGDMEWIEALDLGVLPESYEKLSLLRSRIWNEVMTLLGIDSANQDKKERLVVAEVGANDAQTDSFRNVNLNARRQACEQINEVFGLDISVDFVNEAEKEEELEKQQQQEAAHSYPGAPMDDKDERLKAVN